MSTKPQNPSTPSIGLSRREFVKSSAIATAAIVAGGCTTMGRTGAGAPAIGRKLPERIRIGLIGCGYRGTDAVKDCVKAAGPGGAEVVAMGDLFADRLNGSREELKKLGDACRLSDDRCFTGFDNYKGVLACEDVDLVILATPPGFRPTHLKAAIDAGKHVFMEKPVAVDPTGVRSVIASSDAAAAKGLAIVCGTQRRHQPHYLEIVKRIEDGAIGDIVSAQCYWNQGDLWVKPREPNWSEMEWQCRNWLYFDWLSGDHIVEQHVHNLDVLNWVLGVPVKCVGMGGRQSRVTPEFGNIWDHFSVEYEYTGGVRALSMCRQVKGTSERISERIVGTRGVAYTTSETATITWKRRTWKWEAKGEPVNPYVQEHLDLITSIRKGKPLNEGRRIAESTLTAVMGRMSAYTGRELNWDWALNSSKLDLMPRALAMGDNPVNEVPVPGVAKLV